MKLLILTCSTGGGHTSAARAVAETASEAGAECVIMDALRFLPGVEGKVISRGHTFVYRHMPRLFGVGYRMERRGGARAFRVTCARGARALRRCILEGGYDAVFSVHVFASFMLSELRRRGLLNVPAAQVATDYTCSPGFAECNLDLNFIPLGLRDEFIACGLRPEQLADTGIPVRREFSRGKTREHARRLLKLPKSGPLVLLMCGSMGCGPMEELAEGLSAALPEDGTLAVLCGTNERLKADIEAAGLANVRPVGYTKRVSLWMDAADLIISKPGGLTSSEAMAKRLPMIIVDAVPGCETKNLEYLTARGCARFVPVEDIPAAARELLLNADEREEIRGRIEQNFPLGAAERITEALFGLAKGQSRG